MEDEMKKFIITCLSIFVCISFLVANESQKVKVQVLLPTDRGENFRATDKTDGGIMLILESEIEPKIYKTVKPISLFEGKYMAHMLYFERPNLEIHPSKEDYISKEEYDANPEAYKNKDIFLERLPIGTLLQLEEIKLDSGHLSSSYYYMKILNIPKYKDQLVDAVCISYMGIYGVWQGDWWFADKEKRLIKTKKLPLINKNYAKELTKKEYEKYRETGNL